MSEQEVFPSEFLKSGDYLKPLWFKALVVGNMLWPLVNVGIFTFSCTAVLEDLPVDGTSFLRSTFSAEQVAKLRQLTTSVYKNLNMNKEIPEERFQLLWKSVKAEIIAALLDHFGRSSDGPFWHFEFESENNDLVADLDYFFRDRDHLTKLCTAITSGRDQLLSPQGIALAKLHRFTVIALHTKSGRENRQVIAGQAEEYASQKEVDYHGIDFPTYEEEMLAKMPVKPPVVLMDIKKF